MSNRYSLCGLCWFDTFLTGFYHEWGSSNLKMPQALPPILSESNRTSTVTADFSKQQPPRAKQFVVLVVFLLLSVPFAATSAFAQAQDQLKINGYVNDFAHVLSAGMQAQLAALSTEVNQKAQAQIVVVTIKSLGGRPIEDYSIDLATRLGIGPKQSNRGVLLLFAVDDHRYRTEVGYGLEEILPDGKTGGFGREAVPYLRQSNYDAAIFLMASRIAQVIAADRGVHLTGAAAPSPRRDTTGSLGVGELFLLFFLIFIVFSILRRAGGGPRSRFGGGGWVGPVIGGGVGGWGGGFGGGGGGGGGFGGFGGGSFGGGGSSGSW